MVQFCIFFFKRCVISLHEDIDLSMYADKNVVYASLFQFACTPNWQYSCRFYAFLLRSRKCLRCMVTYDIIKLTLGFDLHLGLVVINFYK